MIFLIFTWDFTGSENAGTPPGTASSRAMKRDLGRQRANTMLGPPGGFD